MTRYYNIHDLYVLEVDGDTSKAGAYIARELKYFEVEHAAQSDLKLVFTDKVVLPNTHVSFLRDLAYDRGTLFFLSAHGGVVIPVKDLSSGTMVIKAENTINPEFLFAIIEKILMLKFLEKGYCLLHAACFSENGNVRLYSSLPGTGKTTSILTKCEKGALFLSDDLTIVDKAGAVYAYPRAFSLGKHHGKYFEHHLGRLGAGKRFKYRLLKSVLSVSIVLTAPVPKVQKKFKNYSASKDYFRVRMEDVIPGLKILKKAELGQLIVAFRGGEPVGDLEDWDKKRAVSFLLHNTNRELFKFVSLHFGAFLSYGDDISNQVEGYLTRVMQKQREIIEAIVDRYPVEVFMNEKNKVIEPSAYVKA